MNMLYGAQAKQWKDNDEDVGVNGVERVRRDCIIISGAARHYPMHRPMIPTAANHNDEADIKAARSTVKRVTQCSNPIDTVRIHPGSLRYINGTLRSPYENVHMMPLDESDLSEGAE